MYTAAIEQTRDRFRDFPRPLQVVVHDPDPTDVDPKTHCIDCPWVSKSLESHDCHSLYSTEEPFFHRIPLDCLNVAFFPAMFKQSFGAEGKKISETLVWIFGVDSDDWDNDQTISQQMAPRLNSMQMASVLDYLIAVQQAYRLSPHSVDQLTAAISFWSQQVNAARVNEERRY